jgi:hypothetical protein
MDLMFTRLNASFNFRSIVERQSVYLSVCLSPVGGVLDFYGDRSVQSLVLKECSSVYQSNYLSL